MLTRQAIRYRQERAGDFTDAQWEAMLILAEHRCYYCGEVSDQLGRDHKVPMSRGGVHTAANIVPACPRCNSSKGVMTPEEWAESAEQRRKAAETPDACGMDDDYLTISQAAELLGYYRTSVYHLITAGKLRTRELGPRALLVHRGDVEELRARGRPASGRKRSGEPKGAADATP